jgi:serralysin
MPLSHWTLAQVLDQLDSGEHWSGNTITYTFPSNASGMFFYGENGGFRAVTPTQQTFLTLALTSWDELIRVNMAQGTSGNSNIEFAFTSTDIGYAHAYFPDIGSVWFNVTEPDLVSPVIGGYGYDTYIHEIGHALGLDHMGDYNGVGNWSPSSFQDSEVLSVMSYFGPRDSSALYSPDVMQADWTDASGVAWSPQTPMLNDIMAIQAIYGASTTTRLGDTVYGFNSNVAGPMNAIFDFGRNAHPVLAIFDSGGARDTLDFSGWSAPSVMDLRGGGFSSANHMTNNVAISYDTVIEDAVGGSGSDLITGNAASNQLIGGAGNDELRGLAGDDILIGGAGNDLIDGGDGSGDTAVFDGVASAYAITVSNNMVTLTGPGGTDRVTHVERFRFADVTRLLVDLIPDADITAPLLQSTNPADGAAGIAIGADLTLTFNEPVRAGTGSIDIFRADGTLWRSIASDDLQQVRYSGNAVTLNPAANLAGAASYHVTVSPGAITDLGGNPFAGITSPTAWNFSTSTSDSTAPRIVRVTPGDEDSQVALDASLVIEFDEPVTAGSGKLIVQRNGQVVMSIAVSDTSQVQVQGTRVVVDPTGLFSPGGSYAVAIDAGAFKDSAGNSFAGLAADGSWNFATSAPIAGDDYPMGIDTPGLLRTTGNVVKGRIDAPTDGDMFKVDLVAGTIYRIDMLASTAAMDPYLVLYSPELELLDFDDDGGPGDDAQIHFTPSASGTFFVAASDNAGVTGSYSLSASIATTTGVLSTTGRAAFGSITAPTDSDLFAADLSAGTHYTIDLQRIAGGLVDPYLTLFDAMGKALAFDDDGGGDGNARLGFAPAVSGTYYLSAADFSTGLGGYKMTVSTRPLVDGTNGADNLQGSPAAEILRGQEGADRLTGGGGDDLLDGGGNIDTAVYSGPRSALTLEPAGPDWRVTDTRVASGDGTDLLQGIERLEFSDQKLALDLGGHAGHVARLLGAVFGAAAVQNTGYAGVGLALMDGGMPAETLAQLALDVALGPAATPGAVVDLLYRNLTGATPPEAAVSLYTGLLADGTYTPATLALLAGSIELNLHNIGWTDLVANGLAYT